MKANDLKAEINKRLSDINGKISRLRKELKNEESNKDFEEVFADMEAIRDDIIHQYNVINTLKMNAEEKLKEMEKKIFTSIQSFDKAYNEAGGILKSPHMKNHRHSIDFKNPWNTK